MMGNYIKLLKGFIGILLFSLLVGCSETIPVTRYYFLEPPAYPQKNLSDANKYRASLLVKKFDSIAPYNTENFVVKIRPSEVRFYNYAKWVSPPQEMLHHYFFKALTFSQLTEIAIGRSLKKNVYQLEVEIQEFGQSLVDQTPYGTMTIFVGIGRVGSKVYEWNRTYHQQQKARSEQPYDVVVALNQAMVQLNQKFLKDLDVFLASNSNNR